MSNLEHYFENLLFMGKDVHNNCNRDALTIAEREAVETCAAYVMYTMFNDPQELRDYLHAWTAEEMQEWVDNYYWS